MSFSFITSNPKILSGEPIIWGTRTPVRAIVELVHLGLHPEVIPDHLPHLTVPQVFEALQFYEENQSLIDDYIERNSLTADEVENQLLYA